LDIEDMSFFTLPENTRTMLSEAAKYFEEGLKKLNSGAGTKGAKAFFEEFTAYKNSAKVFSFMSKIAVESGKILKGGIKNAYEQVAKSLPGLELEEFLALPDDLGRKIGNQLSSNEILKDFLLEVNLNQEQLDQFSGLLEEGISGEELLGKMKMLFPELRSESQKQTDDLVEAARDALASQNNLNDSVNKLDANMVVLNTNISKIAVPNYGFDPKQIYGDREFRSQQLFQKEPEPVAERDVSTFFAEQNKGAFESLLSTAEKFEAAENVSNEQLREQNQILTDLANNVVGAAEAYDRSRGVSKAVDKEILAKEKERDALIVKRDKIKSLGDDVSAESFTVEINKLGSTIDRLKSERSRPKDIKDAPGIFLEKLRADFVSIFNDPGIFNLTMANRRSGLEMEPALYKALLEAATVPTVKKEDREKYLGFAEMLKKGSPEVAEFSKKLTPLIEKTEDISIVVGKYSEGFNKGLAQVMGNRKFFEVASVSGYNKENEEFPGYKTGTDAIKEALQPLLENMAQVFNGDKKMVERFGNELADRISQNKMYGESFRNKQEIGPEFLAKFFNDEKDFQPYFERLNAFLAEFNMESAIKETTSKVQAGTTEVVSNLVNLGNAVGYADFNAGINTNKIVSAIDNLFNRPAPEQQVTLPGVNVATYSGISGLGSGFATGGYITGPGGPTSDLIPAMLSNQEFVVNAAATRKFRPILESINNGSYRGFYKGTSAGTAEIKGKIEKLVIDLKWPDEFQRYMKAIILQESSYKSDIVNPNGGASGFFQFTGQSAKMLNTTLEEIQKMDFDHQAVLFKQYLVEHKITANQMRRFVDAVLVFTAPSKVGASEDTMVYGPNSKGYKANPYWDLDKKGGITVKEFEEFYGRKLKSLPPEDTTSKEPPELPTVGSTYAMLNLKDLTDTWMAIAAIEDPVFKLKNAFASLKINLDSEMIESFGESNIKMLFAMSEAVKDQLANIYKRTNEGAEPEELMKLNKALRESKKEIDKMTKALADLQNKGKAFNDNFFGILQEGMSGLLTGDIEDYGDFGRGLLDKFTKGVVDDFLEGFMQPIKDTDALKGVGVQMASLANTFGEKVAGWLTGVSKPMAAPSIGESSKSEKSGLFSDWKKTADASVAGSAEAICACMKGGGGAYPGSNAAFAGKDAGKEAPLGASTDMFGVLADGLKDSEAPIEEASGKLAETASTGIGEALSTVGGKIAEFASTIGGEIGSVIEHVITGIKAVLDIITKLGGFAGGGKVVGGGSGTSDSILARVSNGEFIVNAKSTKKFSPILEAINSGDYLRGMKGFAMGGVVGASVLAMPIAMSSESATARGNQQVINMNITGDISRQTKAEIYKMLPQIASGVNSVNHNRGSYR